MNNLRLSGQSTWLTWGTFRSRIIIKTFSADYRSPWWIPYQISCLVTHQPGTFQSAPADGAALLALDLSAALSLVAGTGIPLTSLQTALNGESASVPGTSDQAQATSAVQSSLASCDSVIAQTSSELSALPTNPSQATTYSTTFVAAVGSAGSLAAAVNAQAYISRIGNNLQGNAD